jgi:hypothetical protein
MAMSQQPLPLVRTDYIKRPEDPPTLHSESKTDMESYARQLEVIHTTGLHGWGIAGGLEVTAAAGGTTVTIKPGIALQGGPAKPALESQEEAVVAAESEAIVAAESEALAADPGGGRHLSLAANGFAQISLFDEKPQRVPVTEAGVTLGTPQFTGELYLTIQFGEYLNEDNCTSHGICRIYHAPLLRFHLVNAFPGDGSRLVLALVSLSEGKMQGLAPGLRRSLDLPTGSLHFWRGQTTSTSPFTVENVPAGAMTVRDDGGLNLTVARPSDQISLTAPQQEDFARLTLTTKETITTGKVGIGTGSPRTALDMGAGVFSGAASDYLKAQLAMSGGGTVTWQGPGGRLEWTESFIAPLTRSTPGAFGSGFVELAQPVLDIPGIDVYNGTSRSADQGGVILDKNEALYAEHTIGGKSTEITYKIVSLDSTVFIPGNWLLVAAVSGNDKTVKLGTGAIVSARSSFSHGGSLPSGTILMWSGNIDSIPDGWELCTGEGGRTPDLRGRFIVGAGPGYDEPGKHAEATQHTHTVALSSSMRTSAEGNHNHQTSTTWYNNEPVASVAAIITGRFNGVDRGAPNVNQSRTSENGSHAHSLPGVIIGSSDASATLRPRWYALCFIMKR